MAIGMRVCHWAASGVQYVGVLMLCAQPKKSWLILLSAPLHDPAAPPRPRWGGVHSGWQLTRRGTLPRRPMCRDLKLSLVYGPNAVDIDLIEQLKRFMTGCGDPQLAEAFDEFGLGDLSADARAPRSHQLSRRATARRNEVLMHCGRQESPVRLQATGLHGGSRGQMAWGQAHAGSRGLTRVQQVQRACGFNVHAGLHACAHAEPSPMVAWASWPVDLGGNGRLLWAQGQKRA
jgi:hypothetical protein